MHNKSLLIFFVVGLVLSGSAFAECRSSDQPGYDEYSNGKYSYECNVQNLCLGQRYGGDYWNFDTSKQLIIEHDMGKYPNLQKKRSLGFSDVRKIYEDTQNNIMNCAILKSKYTLHKKIIDDYDLSERAKRLLEEANTQIEKQIDEEKCTSPRDGDKVYNYKDLLDSMTYELCGYNMYLYYYRKSAEKNIGLLGAGKEIITIPQWGEALKTEGNRIAQEHELSRRTMDTALSLYENFEKTYAAHVLLEMIEVELTEDKRYIGAVTRIIEQFVSLMKNAQTSQSKR